MYVIQKTKIREKMALLLNVSMCSSSSKLPNPSRQPLSSPPPPPPPPPPAPSISSHRPPQPPRNVLLKIGHSACNAALIAAVLSATANPAIAFIGGGPYGMGVTRGQDLSGKDFSGLTLLKQDFKTSILRQANFHGAKLLGASFFDADLTGADLSDADLRGADFSLANVTKVNLSNANLEGAFTTGNTSFKGSTISGADFTDVPLRDDQPDYLCKIADGVNPTTGNETRDTLFCK